MLDKGTPKIKIRDLKTVFINDTIECINKINFLN